MALTFPSIGEWLSSMANRLNNPIGWIAIILVIIYIWAVVTEKINSPFSQMFNKGGKGGSGGGNSEVRQKPNYKY